MRVIRYGADFTTHLPVSGSGSAMVVGTLLKKGLTSYLGSLVAAGGSSAIPDTVGILKAAHATANDTTLAGTVFTTQPVELTIPFRVVRAEYDQTSVITATAVSTTSWDTTSLEDDIDACFVYVVSGDAAGQTNYATASAAGGSGGLTLKAAFTTAVAIGDTFIKILPRFHKLLSFNSAGTKLASQAAAGAVKGFVLDTWIQREDRLDQMDPTKHAALTGLNATGRITKFFADICVTDSGPYPVA